MEPHAAYSQRLGWCCHKAAPPKSLILHDSKHMYMCIHMQARLPADALGDPRGDGQLARLVERMPLGDRLLAGSTVATGRFALSSYTQCVRDDRSLALLASSALTQRFRSICRRRFRHILSEQLAAFGAIFPRSATQARARVLGRMPGARPLAGWL